MTKSSFLAVAAALLLTAGAQGATKICIDPGHGGTDPGAGGGGLQEADICLATSTNFKSWLDLDTTDTGGGGTWSVIRTRTTDVFVELQDRCDYANNNGAARFMAIHNNSATAAATGIETFCWGSGSTSSFDLRDKVQAEAVAMWPLSNRGGKTANYVVIKNTSMPAELHEMAFITNTGDRVYLGSSTNRNNHAKSELFAIQRHYGIAKYTPTSGGGGGFTTTLENGSAAWSASASWIATTSTPGYSGANYAYRSTVAASDAATWTFTAPAAGSYKVEAWWVAGSNRSATAPYIVDASTGSVTVSKDQQSGGSAWQNLGTFSFAAGTNTVRLSAWTTVGFVVVGDAIRITQL